MSESTLDRLPASTTRIEVVGTVTPTELVRSLMADPKAARHVYALLGVVLTNEGHLPKRTPEAKPDITLGEALREHMHVHRMKRKDLASEIGISYPFLSEMLHDNKVPSMRTLEKIRNAGVDLTRVTFA